MNKAPAKGCAVYWTQERIIVALQAWAEKHGRTPTKVRDWGRAAPDHPACPTVDLRFGSWNAAIEAAGLAPNIGGDETYWTLDRVAAAMLDWLLVHGSWPSTGDWHLADPGRRWPASTSAMRAGGTWNGAKRAAGWTACCRYCDKPLTGLQRLWCSSICRQRHHRHGPVVVVEAGCVGCGGDIGRFTIGCRNCIDRRNQKKRRQLVAAPHLVEPAPLGSEADALSGASGAATHPETSTRRAA